MDQSTAHNPFFSIGVTTYNRIELLKLTLISILSQDFTDFEIIIGNDYLPEPLTKEILGIYDERIIIINNKQNLGEFENMNSLLRLARGSYFTWQFDDDLCAPAFLSESYRALVKFSFPKCVFSAHSYIYGDGIYKFPAKHHTEMRLYSGRDFLRSFLSGKIRILGTSGFFNSDYLKSLGGATQLSEGKMAVYAEYLLIFKIGLSDHIGYLNSKLVAFRVHGNSWSGTTTEAELYRQAGINLVRKSILIFSDPVVREDYNKNLSSLLKSLISMVITKSRLAGIRLSRKDVFEYISLIEKEFNALEEQELIKSSVRCLEDSAYYIPLFHVKAWLKTKVSIRYLKFVHIVISFISRFTNKSF